MIYLDKCQVVSTYRSATNPHAIEQALKLITQALESTPIYYKGNRRTPPRTLMLGAESRIKNTLKGLVSGVQLRKISRDKPIKTNFQHIPSNDRVDVLVLLELSGDTYTIAIEFDAGRADQVSKKFVSRASLLFQERLIYIAYCYPGRKSMSLAEVRKYFDYMRDLSQKLNLVGFIGMAPPRNFHL